MSDIHRDTHVGEVETVAQENQGQGDNMVKYQLFEIFPRLLQQEQQHNCLLAPITGLEQVVCLEDTHMLSMWESLEHGACIKVPQRALRHHIYSKRAENCHVNRSIYLFHESVLLRLALEPGLDGNWSEYSLHGEFSSEAEDDGVIRNEDEIEFSFPIHDGSPRAIGAERIREEYEWVKRIMFARAHKVSDQHGHHYHEWVQPCVRKRSLFPFLQQRAVLPSLRVMFRRFFRGLQRRQQIV